MDKFENGARVVFFGDSITARGTWMRRVLEYYRKNTDIRFEMYNAGVPGDNATNAASRIYDTVLSYEPTDVVVMFGMNDVGRNYYTEFPSDTAVIERRAMIDICLKRIKNITDKLLKEGIRVTLVSPTPYDEFAENETPNLMGTQAALYELSGRIGLYAKNKNVNFVNFNSPMFSVMKKIYRNSDQSIISVDRVHPTLEGFELMASIFLNAQGFDVDIPDDFETLKKLSERPFDEWEEERFRFERRIADAMFIDRCMFGGIKNDDDAVEQMKKIFGEGTSEFISKYVNAFTEYTKNKELFKAELISYTKTVKSS